MHPIGRVEVTHEVAYLFVGVQISSRRIFFLDLENSDAASARPYVCFR